jgi:hypothetical protein
MTAATRTLAPKFAPKAPTPPPKNKKRKKSVPLDKPIPFQPVYGLAPYSVHKKNGNLIDRFESRDEAFRLMHDLPQAHFVAFCLEIIATKD